jgi:hypothetical protein
MGAYTFITPACDTCDMPRWISAGPAACDSIVFVWDSVAAPGGYEYAVVNSPGAPPTSINKATGRMASVGGLTPATPYTIFVRAVCDSTSSSAWKTLLITTPPCPTAVAQTARAAHQVVLYPNPAGQTITLVVSPELRGSMTAEILSADGRVLQHILPTGINTDITISDLPAGFYLLRWTDGHSRQTLRFSKL